MPILIIENYFQSGLVHNGISNLLKQYFNVNFEN